MFKFTARLPDEYREKIEFLKDSLNKNGSDLITFMIDSFIERERLETLQKLELRIEELASRLGWLEDRVRRLEKK